MFHSPPSRSVYSQKRIDMEDQHEPEQHGTVHISEAYIQGLQKDTFEDMISKLTGTFELRLQSFKKKLVQEQNSYMESTLKKYRSNPYVFKRDGNKKQFQHQEK